jgi:RHS repeat-associated protein
MKYSTDGGTTFVPFETGAIVSPFANGSTLMFEFTNGTADGGSMTGEVFDNTTGAYVNFVSIWRTGVSTPFGADGEAPLSGTPSQPHNVDYQWDSAGNRVTMTDSSGAWHNYGTATPLNQYTTDGSFPITPGYNHEIVNYQNLTYSYINDTHLSKVTGSPDLLGYQSTYELSYDALGRCVVRFTKLTSTSGSSTFITHTIYDGEKPILEYIPGSPSSAPRTRTLYGKGIDEILMRYNQGNSPTTAYYQEDHQGNITHLTDGAGNVLVRYSYDAFGKPNPEYTMSGTSQANRFLFNGREYSNLYGIYEYRARAYHPGIGRFMSEDPKGMDADSNMFRYCSNDPLDRVDPMGLEDQQRFPAQVDTLASDEVHHYHAGDLDREINMGAIAIGLAAHRLEMAAKAEASERGGGPWDSGGGSGLGGGLTMAFWGAAPEHIQAGLMARAEAESSSIERLEQVMALAGNKDGKDEDTRTGALLGTHFSYPGDPGGFNRKGDHGNRLNKDSVALTRDLRSQFSDGARVYLHFGGRGHYIGNADDKTSGTLQNRIDAYDPKGTVNRNWAKKINAGEWSISPYP